MPAINTLHSNFKSDERGAVAVIFGLMFVVLTFCAGMAIDYSRVRHTESKFAAAVDAATLAAGRILLNGGSEADARQTALNMFEENVRAGGRLEATYNTPEVDIDTTTGGVTIRVTPVVPMTLTGILGYESINVPVMASTKFDQQDIELGVQLDLTGSMCSPCTKIEALKEATANMIDILLPDHGNENEVRIGLAPYSAGVNVGNYADQVIQNYSGGSTCAYDRVGGSANTDDAPEAGAYYKGDGQISNPNPCPAAQIMPLTSDKSALKSAVSAFTTGGTTAGQLGTNWAWNLISPKWNDIWPTGSKPSNYGKPNTLKAVILMTDGEYNTFEGKCDENRRGQSCDPNGTRGRKSNESAKAMCETMKEQGVVVYTVGFQVNHPAAVDTLGSCASSEDHFFQADDAASLTEAFVAIAQQLSNLRLTN